MFYIGSNVLDWPLEAQCAVADGHEVCVREYPFFLFFSWFFFFHFLVDFVRFFWGCGSFSWMRDYEARVRVWGARRVV
jgi:hypothetical protein